MSCYQIIIDSRDKFFFRDARPISGSDIGEGASWPLPSVFHSAMLSALSEKFPDTCMWESKHVKLTDKEKRKHSDNDGNEKIISNFRLGGLKTWGIFPIKKKQMEDGTWKDEIFVPTPADIEPDGSLMKLLSLSKNHLSNLPPFFKYTVVNTSKPSKNPVYPWLSLSNLEKYLNCGNVDGTTPNSAFYDSETNPGIKINPLTGTTEEGKFYQATYLRMKPDAAMLAFAECEAKKYGEKKGVDLLEILFNEKKSIPIVFGGQRGVAYMQCKREKTRLCEIIEKVSSTNGNIVKWILLSPAVFKKGWLPDWVDNSGNIMLKYRPPREGKTRKEWRDEIKNANKIEATLIAARIPKPLVFSGWKLDKDADNAGGRPKATRLAVPAGAVYYFECHNQDEAQKLVSELHGNVKSSHLGEQGFGLGVCSILKKENIIENLSSNT